jgi:hypothetical protein
MSKERKIPRGNFALLLMSKMKSRKPLKPSPNLLSIPISSQSASHHPHTLRAV